MGWVHWVHGASNHSQSELSKTRRYSGDKPDKPVSNHWDLLWDVVGAALRHKWKKAKKMRSASTRLGSFFAWSLGGWKFHRQHHKMDQNSK